nr:unnamed protein product [Callosobruchus analis]
MPCGTLHPLLFGCDQRHLGTSCYDDVRCKAVLLTRASCVSAENLTHYIFSITTFLAGGFWVYKEYPPRYDPNDGEKYCQKTAYLFAFIWTTIIYVFLLVVLAAFPCFLICICFVSRTSSNEDDVEANLRAGEARSRGERTEQV